MKYLVLFSLLLSSAGFALNPKGNEGSGGGNLLRSSYNEVINAFYNTMSFETSLVLTEIFAETRDEGPLKIRDPFVAKMGKDILALPYVQFSEEWKWYMVRGLRILFIPKRACYDHADPSEAKDLAIEHDEKECTSA